MDPLKDPLTIGQHNLMLHHLLADLLDGQEVILLHVVDCEICRTMTAKAFERRQPDGPERLRELPGRGEPAEAQDAMALTAELMALPLRAREAALHEPRFCSPVLLETLLQQAAAAQRQDPERSIVLAGLADRLAFRVYDDELEPKAVAVAEVRAGTLAGTAHRLLGRFEQAGECLAEAGTSLALFAGLIPEKISWWCQLGLLRWEQGKLDEAEPLLRQAARCAGELALPEREGAVRALLGLLCLERGGTERAARLLQSGRAALAAAPADHPWLFLRAGLGLAFCLAGGNDALARRVFEETLPHYALAGEAEQVRLRWLEGKLTARLGRKDEGASLLARAWRLLLAEPSPGEATLCFLDLAAALADAKRGAEVPALLAEMEAALAAWDGDRHADLRDAVGELTASICKRGRERRKAVAAEAGFTIRRMFRARGHRIEPLPYA